MGAAAAPRQISIPRTVGTGSEANRGWGGLSPPGRLDIGPSAHTTESRRESVKDPGGLSRNIE